MPRSGQRRCKSCRRSAFSRSTMVSGKKVRPCNQAQCRSQKYISSLSDEDYFRVTRSSFGSFQSPSTLHRNITIVNYQIVEKPAWKKRVQSAQRDGAKHEYQDEQISIREKGVSPPDAKVESGSSEKSGKRQKATEVDTMQDKNPDPKVCLCRYDCPSFELDMKKSNVVHGFSLGISRDWSKVHLPPYDFTVTLEDERGSCWEVKYLHRRSDFSAGWGKFAADKGLEMNDHLIFYMLDVTHFKVLILGHDLSPETLTAFREKFFLRKVLFGHS